MEYIILILALVGIVIGADQLVAGAVSIARKFKVSDFVIGAAIVGVGTYMDVVNELEKMGDFIINISQDLHKTYGSR